MGASQSCSEVTMGRLRVILLGLLMTSTCLACSHSSMLVKLTMRVPMQMDMIDPGAPLHLFTKQIADGVIAKNARMPLTGAKNITAQWPRPTAAAHASAGTARNHMPTLEQLIACLYGSKLKKGGQAAPLTEKISVETLTIGLVVHGATRRMRT